MTDVVIIAAWFMLREIELGSTLVRDLGLTATHVTIDVPLHKTAPGGECVMGRRRLECACGVQVQPLCPFHAAQRHLLRLCVRGSVGPDDPLLPAQGGGFTEARRDPQVSAGITGSGRRADVHRPQRQAATAGDGGGAPESSVGATKGALLPPFQLP